MGEERPAPTCDSEKLRRVLMPTRSETLDRTSDVQMECFGPWEHPRNPVPLVPLTTAVPLIPLIPLRAVGRVEVWGGVKGGRGGPQVPSIPGLGASIALGNDENKAVQVRYVDPSDADTESMQWAQWGW